MYFSWNEQTLEWILAASAVTGFHRELAARLRPWLTPGGTLADLGCGAGLIDLELAGHAGQITCIDRTQAPLDFLLAQAARRGVSNVDTLCADAREVEGLWDDVLMCFYGSGDALVDTFLPHCRSHLVAVIRSGEESAFGPPDWREHHQDLLGLTISSLNARGVRYHLELETLEYGQPLKSWADGMHFVRSGCRPEVPDAAMEAFLERTLQQRTHSQWPYYLPNQKHFGIFVIPRRENEHLLCAQRSLVYGP